MMHVNKIESLNDLNLSTAPRSCGVITVIIKDFLFTFK